MCSTISPSCMPWLWTWTARPTSSERSWWSSSTRRLPSRGPAADCPGATAATPHGDLHRRAEWYAAPCAQPGLILQGFSRTEVSRSSQAPLPRRIDDGRLLPRGPAPSGTGTSAARSVRPNLSVAVERETSTAPKGPRTSRGKVHSGAAVLTAERGVKPSSCLLVGRPRLLLVRMSRHQRAVDGDDGELWVQVAAHTRRRPSGPRGRPPCG